MLFNIAKVTAAVKEAADKAAEKGVKITVQVEEHGFMGDHLSITVTAEPLKKEV